MFAMFLAYVIVAVLLALALIFSGMGKLRRMEPVTSTITGLGVPLSWFPRLAAALIAGGLGLIIGIWVPAIGVAAAIGIVVYFAGAVVAHLRAGDTTLMPPVTLGLLGAAALVLRLAG